MPRPVSAEELLARGPMDESPELRMLFHRLNNQLGIILANAELLEAKAGDEMTRARASQVVASVLDGLSHPGLRLLDELVDSCHCSLPSYSGPSRRSR